MEGDAEQRREDNILRTGYPVREDATGYDLYTNPERTVLLTVWQESGVMTVATREDSSNTWGPPIELKETS